MFRTGLEDLLKIAALPPIDISDYEKKYDTFDPGHDAQHMREVSSFATELAKRYAPKKIELASLAGKLHDIGIEKNREGHEGLGADIVAADPRFNVLAPRDKALLLEAIREHRASTGNPKSTIAKIISDADKSPASPSRSLDRAVGYGVKHFPDLTDDEQMRRALALLAEDYGPNGKRRHVYYPETLKRIEDMHKVINDLHTSGNLEGARALLKGDSL